MTRDLSKGEVCLHGEAETSSPPGAYRDQGVKEALADAQVSRLAAPLRRLLATGPAGADRLSLRMALVAAVPAVGDYPRGGLLLSEGAAVAAGSRARWTENGLRPSRRAPRRNWEKLGATRSARSQSSRIATSRKFE